MVVYFVAQQAIRALHDFVDDVANLLAALFLLLVGCCWWVIAAASAAGGVVATFALSIGWLASYCAYNG